MIKLICRGVKHAPTEVSLNEEESSFDDLREKIVSTFELPENSKITLIHNTVVLKHTTEKLKDLPALKDGDKIFFVKCIVTPKPASTPAAHGATTTSGAPAPTAGAEAPAPALAGSAPTAAATTTGAATAAPVSTANATSAPAAEAAADATATAASAAVAAATDGANATAPQPDGANATAATAANAAVAAGGAPDVIEAVNNLCSMGFERPNVLRAMRAAYNHADRAYQFLSDNQIPLLEEDLIAQTMAPGHGAAPNNGASNSTPAAASNVTEPTSTTNAQEGVQGLQSQPMGPLAPPAATPSHTPTPGATAAPTGAATGAATASAPAGSEAPPGAMGGGAGAMGGVGGGRASAIAEQLRMLVRTHPEALPQILAELSQQNPQLGQLINSDPQGFLRMLMSEGQDMGGEGGEGGEGGAGGRAQIELSEEEYLAVQSLVSLGFSEDEAIEAFIACDRNVELAGDFLMDSRQ